MEPILDITTFKRTKLRIDGKVYEMYTRKEISVEDAEKLRHLYLKIVEAEKVKKPNKAQRVAYEKLLRQFVSLIFVKNPSHIKKADAGDLQAVAFPRSVLARLERPDLVAIIKAYFQPPQAVTPTRKGNKAATSTGAK